MINKEKNHLSVCSCTNDLYLFDTTDCALASIDF